MLQFSYVFIYEIPSDKFTKTVPQVIRKGTTRAHKFSQLASLKGSSVISLKFYLRYVVLRLLIDIICIKLEKVNNKKRKHELIVHIQRYCATSLKCQYVP